MCSAAPKYEHDSTSTCAGWSDGPGNTVCDRLMSLGASALDDRDVCLTYHCVKAIARHGGRESWHKHATSTHCDYVSRFIIVYSFFLLRIPFLLRQRQINPTTRRSPNGPIVVMRSLFVLWLKERGDDEDKLNIAHFATLKWSDLISWKKKNPYLDFKESIA